MVGNGAAEDCDKRTICGMVNSMMLALHNADASTMFGRDVQVVVRGGVGGGS
jgi:hypothetical protein